MTAIATADESPVPTIRRPATFFPGVGADEPLFRDWLRGHREAMFRWTLGRAANESSRREFVQAAVSIQRLRGEPEFLAWLYGAALQSASSQGAGGLPEATLAGLAPDLRSVLRLVSRQAMRLEEAVALMPQRVSYVRGRLLQTRMRG